MEDIGFNVEQDSDFEDILKVRVQVRKDRFVDEIKRIIDDFPFSNSNVYVDKIAAEMVFCGSSLYFPGIKKVKRSSLDNFVLIRDFSSEIITGIGVPTKTFLENSQQKKGTAVETNFSPYLIPNIREIPSFEPGDVTGMSFSSSLVARVLDPQPGDKILDACAAPGNKTLHVSALSKNKARIIAVDRSKSRLSRLQRIVEDKGYKNIQPISQNFLRFAEEYNGTFTKILLDPPCTSLGVRPQIYSDVSLEQSLSLSHYQKGLLYAAVSLLEKGGYLVYSTCTISPLENEGVINFALEKLPVELCTLDENIRKYGSSPFSEIYPEHSLEKALRIHPYESDNTGFFIALFRKTR